MKNRTVFITAFQNFISRSILITGPLEELVSRGAHVIIFVSDKKVDYYRNHFENENVSVEGIDEKLIITRKEEFLHSFATNLLDTNVKGFQKRRDLLEKGKYIKFITLSVFTKVCANISAARFFFRWFDKRFSRTSVLDAYFEKYQPDTVFTPYIFGKHDVVFGKAAQHRGVTHVGGILSWDNATTKTLMRIAPDRLIAQNEVIKAEAVKYHSVDPNTVCVTGVAHYDYYRAYTPLSRTAFFKQMNIDPKEKLVLISPAGSKFIATDWHIFEMLKNAYAKGELPHDVHFLIRPHPANQADFGDFEPNEHFTIDVPGVRFKGVRGKDNELSKNDIHHLVDTLTYTDVLINTVSTIAIDGATLDVPTVTIAFDGYRKNEPFSRSTKRYLSDEYMTKLLSVGGSEEVHTEQELIAAINKYLKDRTYRKTQRQNVIAQQCYRLDGKAKERIASCVLGTYA